MHLLVWLINSRPYFWPTKFKV